MVYCLYACTLVTYMYVYSSSHVLQGVFPEGKIEVKESITKLSDDPPLYGVGPTG